ncbi:ribosomal protection-like ABC-F family protein [Bacillus sp. N1-1]|jgi:macrolide transport system ATP-binding/permease protein|uniref:ribosomal protection-like ABC-F family protein n=1 Tax=Bacillus sp. N1-1 TaxID=2682541 RepID=UPI0013199D7F|nr:ABC-F type ribosomal protection protein [Bacillus sp. N1-1]QHA90686.1 ABC-F type ribosomal protection protein [Bacillus sp. N1-1]
MNVMSIKGLKKTFNENILFHHVNIDIHQGERIGIVGPNGAGKTTLARMIVKEIDPDEGTISCKGKIGYLKQSIDQEGMIENHRVDGDSFDFKREKELGIRLLNLEAENLSGGEKLKLALTNVWSTNPDLLILDEPTNHLDEKGVNWLIRELHSFQGAVLVISHDRYFLDQTINRILEVEAGMINDYQGNYSAYRVEKQNRYEEQLHHYSVQQKEVKRIEGQLAGLTNWSEKAHRDSTKQDGAKEYYRMKAKKMDRQVKSKQKRLEKELQKNKLEQPDQEKAVRFQFQGNNSRGKRVLEAMNAGKCYEERWLFRRSSFYMKYGERIGVIGENGCGKTTLLRTLLGLERPSEGEVWKSPSLKIGYLSQDVHDLPEDKTALEVLNVVTKEEIFQAKSILASMGMERVNATINQLSLGERTKLKLTRMLMNKYDLLILDEPTNHLDLPSREQLESTLQSFTGSLLIVSHDVYFLEKMCDRLLVFEDQRVKRVEMNLSDFRSRTKEKSSFVSSKKDEEQKMLLDNEISALISEISLLLPGDEKLAELDSRLKVLVEKKRLL